MDREGGRCCRGGWISRMLCRCEGPVCSHPAPVPSHKAFPSWIGVLSAGRLLEASTWDLSIGTTAQSCQASWLAGQVTCFCTRRHIFLPKGPQAASLLLPRAWLVLIYNLRICPSPSSIIFSPFPPTSVNNLPCNIKLKFSAFPLNSWLTSHRHISILVMSYFLLSWQKYLSNCSSNPLVNIPDSDNVVKWGRDR